MSIRPIGSPPMLPAALRGKNIAAGDVFAQALKAASTGAAEGSFAGAQSLSKDQMLQILHEVRTQMNNRLLRAVAGDPQDDTEVRLAALYDRIRLPEVSVHTGNTESGNVGIRRGRGNHDFEPIIRQAAETYGVDADLISSVIAVESNFNPLSTSPKGAMGLMQLMPGTARDLNVNDAYDPAQNIRAGTRYLKLLLDRYDGNTDMALAAYNWGMGNLERKPAQMPSETINYIKRVKGRYELAKTMTTA